MNINYENRIVAFLDILGFRSLINDSENDKSKIITIYKALDYLKTYEKPKEWNLEFIEIEEDAQKKGVKSFDIVDKTNCTCFSDSIVVSVIIDENNIEEITSTLIANIAYISSVLLEDGILLRGGITIGKLIHKENGVILGQGLIEAFELESKYSKYPRIILSDKLIQELNYPFNKKGERYPYHQYLKRFDDGCVGFTQLTFLQVTQSWEKMSKHQLKDSLDTMKSEILKGLDRSFQTPDIHMKYQWLKIEYNELIILENGIKEKILEINENLGDPNIHYSYTDEISYKK